MPKYRRPRQTYSSELADRICQLLADGLTLRKICKMSGMPSRRSIFYWLEEKEEFRQKYEIARLMQVEYWAHEIVEIADDTASDYVINEHGERVVDHENINRARLRVDTRKWLMSKLLPKRYGERAAVELDVNDRLADRLEAARRRALAKSEATGTLELTRADGGAAELCDDTIH
jgi:hypothetical protein